MVNRGVGSGSSLPVDGQKGKVVSQSRANGGVEGRVRLMCPFTAMSNRVLRIELSAAKEPVRGTEHSQRCCLTFAIDDARQPEEAPALAANRCYN